MAVFVVTLKSGVRVRVEADCVSESTSLALYNDGKKKHLNEYGNPIPLYAALFAAGEWISCIKEGVTKTEKKEKKA